MANKNPNKDIRKAPGRPKKPKLNPKQEAFVQAYIVSGNENEAKRVAGFSQKTDVLRTEKVAMSVQEHRQKMEDLFRNASELMYANLLTLATGSKSDMVKFQATKDLLDRAGFKPADKREISGSDGNAIAIESRITHDLLTRYLALDDKTSD